LKEKFMPEKWALKKKKIKFLIALDLKYSIKISYSQYIDAI